MLWSVRPEDHIPRDIDPFYMYLWAFNFKEEDLPASLEELEREYCLRTKHPISSRSWYSCVLGCSYGYVSTFILRLCLLYTDSI